MDGKVDMVKTQTILQVFLASPGDVSEERKIVEEIILEFNQTWSSNQGIRLELIKWETHARPGFGDDAQDVINQQIGNEYDVFIGIMWTRFGTPTSRAESGTEEEFQRAYSRFRKSSDPLEILFYFKNTAVKPSEIDIAQLEKIHSLKKKFRTKLGGFYSEFNEADEFRNTLRINLSMLVQDWSQNHSNVMSPPQHQTSIKKSIASDMSIDEDDDGLFEIIEQANEAIEKLNTAINSMAEATDDIGIKAAQRSKELDNIVGDNTKLTKRIINSAADDLDIYVKRMEVDIDTFEKQHTQAMNSFGKIAILTVEDFQIDKAEVKQAYDEVKKYKKCIPEVHKNMSGFKTTIEELPRMTTKLNLAKKRTVSILNHLLEHLNSAENQADDVLNLLKRML